MLIITQPEFRTTTWQSAFKDAQVVNNTVLPHTQAERIKLFRKHDIVLLLCNIPNWEPLMAELKVAGSTWMALSRETSMIEFRKIIAAGARGYLDALIHPDSMQTAVNSVLSGGLWIPEPYMGQLISSVMEKLPQIQEPDLSKLSTKESQVAKLIAKGSSNKEVALALNVSERTIKSHLTQIYTKLNIRDRMQLMLYMQGHPIS